MAIKRRKGPDIPRMNDVQLLSHLLTMSGTEATPARELSHALLDTHGDLDHVLRLPRDELLSYPDLGEGAAAFLVLISALLDRYIGVDQREDDGVRMHGEGTSEEVRPLLERCFTDQSVERVCAFLLGDDHRLITSVTVAQGGRSAVSCSVRRVLELTLNHRAKAVILAHNHPDGTAEFSRSDLLSTGVLLQELSLVEVPLLDHYLLSRWEAVSLRRYLAQMDDPTMRLLYFRVWFPGE